MPSKKVQKQISAGIQKLIREYKRTGKITTSRATYRPRSLEHAIKIASAIEYGRARQEGKIKRRPTGSGVFTDNEIVRGYKTIWSKSKDQDFQN